MEIQKQKTIQLAKFYKRSYNPTHTFNPLGLEPSLSTGLEPVLDAKVELMSLENTNKYYVTAYYRFLKIADTEFIQKKLEEKAEEIGIRGLVILGTEGFNSTVAAKDTETLEAWKKFICELFDVTNVNFKDSESDKSPFRRFKVKVREEIVTTGIPGIMPPEGINHHLTPSEWNKVLKEEKDWVMIDTRNWYEYKIGTFKGALNPNIEKFTDFPAYIEAQGIPKDKKMLIFCTGGIRCEKGILELQNQGYDNVFQLDGGILNYLKEYPNDQFEGDCFVFDHRVAVGQDLKPTTKFGLCPHCGQPSTIDVECKRCDTHALVCDDCIKIEYAKDTCSKDCAYQLKMHPERKSKKQLVPFEIEKMKEAGKDLSSLSPLRVTRNRYISLNKNGEATTVSTKSESN